MKIKFQVIMTATILQGFKKGHQGVSVLDGDVLRK